MRGDGKGALELLRGIDVRALAGSACLWAWVDTMYKSGFFKPFDPKPYMAEVAVWLTFLLIVAVSVAVLAARGAASRHFADRATALACGVCGSVGSALFIAAALTGSWAVLVAGAVLSSVFMGMSILQWGALYCREGERSATLYVAGGFACVLIPDVSFMVMESVASAVIPATLPLISAGLFALLPADMRAYRQAPGTAGVPGTAGPFGAQAARPAHPEQPGRPAQARRGPFARVRLSLGVSTSTVCSLALIMMGLGYMHHQMSFALAPTSGHDVGLALSITRCVISAVIFAWALLASRHTHVMYRMGLLAIIAGFSLMPLLASSDAFWLSGAVVLSGYTTFDVLIWIIVAQVAYAGMSDGFVVTCAVRMLVSSLFCGLGGVAGILLDSHALAAPFPYSDSIFVGYLMTIAAVLVLSGRDVWELFDARPAVPTAAQPDAQRSVEEALDGLAQSWGLTEREREVFGYLAVGRTQPWVAERLAISESTVNSHVRHIYAKAGVNSRQGLLDLVFRAQSPEPVDTPA